MRIVFDKAETARCLVEAIETHDQAFDLAASWLRQSSRGKSTAFGIPLEASFSLGKKFVYLFFGRVEGAI